MGGCDAQGPLGPNDQAADADGTLLASRSASTSFTATDVGVGVIDPGVATVKTADQVVIEGLTALSRFEASDARITGMATVVANGVLSLIDGSGPVGGSFRIDVDQGGFWEGTWNGFRELTGPAEWTGTLKLIGSGHGGAIDGMRMAGTEIITTFEVVPTAFVGAVDGRISAR